MKMKYALVTGLFLATGLIAQTTSRPPVPPVPAAVATPAPAPAVVAPVATNKPAAKQVVKKPAPKRPAFVEKTVTLVPGAATVNARNVNVRGRSTILSEVLMQLNKGDTVMVIEQVANKWAKGDDMKQWAHITYPSNAPVWVFAAMVDANKVVTASKLNLRGGPGENYSIVGRLTKGATVSEISTKGEWMQIQPTPGCSAFVAAMFLKQDATTLAAVEPVAPTVPTVPPASTNLITEMDPIVAAVADAAISNAAMAELNAFAAEMGGTNAAPVEIEEPLPPRVVMREGIVNNATSIQAPTIYGLSGMDTGRTINYLHTTSTNVNLFRYVGRRVIVTGEESLDERWPNTPVLTLQRIQVVDEK